MGGKLTSCSCSEGVIKSSRLDVIASEVENQKIQIYKSKQTPQIKLRTSIFTSKIISNLPEIIEKVRETSISPLEGTNTSKFESLKIQNQIFEGEFNEIGEFNGKGGLLTEEGFYEGSFKSGKFSGKGRFINKYGDSYEGDWKEGKANGYGKYKYRGRLEYEGAWEDDQQHGKGREKTLEGEIYTGDFVKGEKQGNARIEYSSGNVYQGTVQNGIISGKGVFYWKDGRKYSGDWKNSEMNGKGQFIWPNGDKYSGEYRGSKRFGQGEYCFSQIKIDGTWREGLLEGYSTVINSGTATVLYENSVPLKIYSGDCKLNLAELSLLRFSNEK